MTPLKLRKSLLGLAVAAALLSASAGNAQADDDRIAVLEARIAELEAKERSLELEDQIVAIDSQLNTLQGLRNDRYQAFDRLEEIVKAVSYYRGLPEGAARGSLVSAWS